MMQSEQESAEISELEEHLHGEKNMTSRGSGTVDKSGIITLLQASILKRSLCHKWRSQYDREDLEIVKQQMYAFHASIGG